jgi:hypothetical protein
MLLLMSQPKLKIYHVIKIFLELNMTHEEALRKIQRRNFTLIERAKIWLAIRSRTFKYCTQIHNNIFYNLGNLTPQEFKDIYTYDNKL